MLIANKTHKILLVLYAMIVFFAVWGLTSQTQDHFPVTVWVAMGAVGAAGAMLEILTHFRTRAALTQMKEQIRKMGQSAEVGLVMLDEQWPVEGLAGILNEYLTLIRGRFNELNRERRELDLLVRVEDAEKRNAEAIVASSSDAVLVVNPYGELTLANRRAEELFNFKFSRSKGLPVDGLIADERLRSALDAANWRFREPMHFEYHRASDNGPPHIFEVTVSPVYVRSEELWALVMTLGDVTQARQLEQMKNDFVDHVSHELRTPLSSIKAYTELLLDGEAVNELQRKEFYQIIESEADRLDRFVETMLNLNRIESGAMSASFARLTLGEELERAADLTRLLAREKSITLDYAGLTQGIEVWADRDLMRQVVINLLSNAIKYTPEGGRVALSAGLAADGHGYWVAVQDNGMGIAPDEQVRIFDKFYRVARGRDQCRGTGLGLTLVKKVVEQIHHGRIEIDSAVGEGSTFTLHLPIDPNALRPLDQPEVEVTTA